MKSIAISTACPLVPITHKNSKPLGAILIVLFTNHVVLMVFGHKKSERIQKFKEEWWPIGTKIWGNKRERGFGKKMLQGDQKSCLGSE